ncbi:low-co2 inducible protein lcib [Tribonema minus]|uniref:Low-co2 inducible protein lcib n=1 Tax=Tribonema minus TaxID=303371 RepID=A0A835ZEI4_9STRA|nr:low-co2 inducible protein lcib [Tribonema minus]
MGAFFDSCEVELDKLGFRDESTIACIGICRDEICGALVEETKARFGDLFVFRGLGGFIFCGKTGFRAAHAHSPLNEDGREKYLYIVAPHIGISADGTLGTCDRKGRGGTSHACGALHAFHQMLRKGHVDTRLAMDDIEMSVMSQLLIQDIEWGSVPDFGELTKIAARVIIRKQLEEIIRETVDTSRADYAVVAGIQIHGPGYHHSFFMPMQKHCYAVVKGKRVALPVTELKRHGAGRRRPAGAAAGALATTGTVRKGTFPCHT